ncbi:MAG: type I methionyl aminopeptidase [Verrucomicrobia bacterium]|nr:type I methionyl aminopeptidase [Verrucomicrobiota bacterium]
MVYLKTEEEIELIRESSLLVGKTLAEVAKWVEPGVTPLELDRVAETYIRDHGAVPGFKGYNGFPNTLCTSVNDQVVHGIPSNSPLQNGDIISVDCGVIKNEFYGDVAYTFPVGLINDKLRHLLETTKECLELGVKEAIAGNRIGDIGQAVQAHAEAKGYGVVRELVGHGLGKSLHEAPEVPNYGKKGKGLKLKKGMVLAIEPMINMGKRHIKQDKDGWTIVTADSKPSAHYEHNVVVRESNVEVLSSHKYIEEVLNKKG